MPQVLFIQIRLGFSIAYWSKLSLRRGSRVLFHSEDNLRE